MLYFLFKSYIPTASLALWLLIPLTICWIIAAGFLLGKGGRKTQSDKLSEREKRIIASLILLPAITVSHFAALLVRPWALAEMSSRGHDQWWFPIVYGPPRSSPFSLAGGMLFTLFWSATAAYGAYYINADGGPLREFINRLRDPWRRRGEVGSATFCLPQDFLRLSKTKGEGSLRILGVFYGKQSRDSKPNDFYRLDAGPNRGPNATQGITLSAEDQARGMAVIGATGTGKSQAIILPITADTMRLGHSILMVDPQGELSAHVIRFAAVTGHRVIIHDPTSTTLARYNLAEGIESSDDAQAISKVLIPDPPGGGGGEGGFWHTTAQKLLAAMLLRYSNLGEILLACSDVQALAAKLAEKQDAAAYLAASFIASAKSDGKVAANTIATIQATAISSWAEENVRNATEFTDFTASMLVEEPTCIILRCPARYSDVYGPYLGAILNRLQLDLDTIGNHSPTGKLPRPVKIVLDEFPLLGRLDSVVRNVNIFRKRQISFLIALQTISQINAIYGQNAAEALIAGMATQIVFGSCDAPTANYLTRIVGKSTDKTPSKRENNPDPSIRQRDLMTIDEVINPPRGNCTILFKYATTTYATQLVLLAELVYMFERDDWKEMFAAVGKTMPAILRRPQISPELAAQLRELRASGKISALGARNPAMTHSRGLPT